MPVTLEDMDLGRKIMNLRLDRRLQQQEVAKACGITASALSKIEAGINEPRGFILFRLARQLGVTCEYLLDETQRYPYRPPDKPESQDAANPKEVTRCQVTGEEKALLEKLRRARKLTWKTAQELPYASIETLAIVHRIVGSPDLPPQDAKKLRGLFDLHGEPEGEKQTKETEEPTRRTPRRERRA